MKEFSRSRKYVCKNSLLYRRIYVYICIGRAQRIFIIPVFAFESGKRIEPVLNCRDFSRENSSS